MAVIFSCNRCGLTFEGKSRNGLCDLCKVALENGDKKKQKTIFAYLEDGQIRPCVYCGTRKYRNGKYFKNNHALQLHESRCRKRVRKKQK